ncbi:ATP-binding cassette domain-containing protein [Pandoraea pulmonicola]|nr:ATP-binding cassette domain-containing protein [Pandoraea pulmonicola]SUA89512.1 Glutamine transport ATP-binding protein GlnQ [Pandoraea pulmonicola]
MRASAGCGAPIIEMNAVSKWFGEFQVLTDIDLTVAAGERIVICGPSGSGKSTLIRCINRLEPVQRGRIVEQAPPSQFFDNPQHDKTRQFLGQLPNHPAQ